MKNYILFSLILVMSYGANYAQSPDSTIEVGDVFVIGEAYGRNYVHINFPSPNAIVKRGGMVNYHTLKGKEVEVTSIKEKKNGSLRATIKLTSKGSFFNSHKFVTVDLNNAISTGELVAF